MMNLEEKNNIYHTIKSMIKGSKHPDDIAEIITSYIEDLLHKKQIEFEFSKENESQNEKTAINTKGPFRRIKQ